MGRKMSKSDKLYVWVDCEMTGLDVWSDRLLEICVVITDRELNVIDESPSYVIYQPQSILERMDEWNQKQHRLSGLYELVQKSSQSVTEIDALLTAWISQHVTEKTAPLCGNSIHQDRMFLKRYLPDFEEQLHYRHIDVSTLKELFRDKLKAREKKEDSDHRARSDIYDSINELKFYLQHLSFKANDESEA